jgi:hypothetical protein
MARENSAWQVAIDIGVALLTIVMKALELTIELTADTAKVFMHKVRFRVKGRYNIQMEVSKWGCSSITSSTEK